LARLNLQTRPKAIISSATSLLPSTRQELEAHFACPVIDLYSTNETGPIAHAIEVDGQSAHELICADLWVEIVREDGTPCAENERGEIAVSGGRNPFLPLLRYRTGDFAAMRFRTAAPPLLLDFEGRAPVVFRTFDGREIANIDITHALRHLLLTQFSLHQNADWSLRFRWRGEVNSEAIETILQSTLGQDLPLELELIDDRAPITGKLITYSSDA